MSDVEDEFIGMPTIDIIQEEPDGTLSTLVQSRITGNYEWVPVDKAH